MKYLLITLVLLAGCHQEENCTKSQSCFSMISISDAIPVQFWLNGVESYNTKIEPGIEKICFNQLFNADDEIRIQFIDETGRTYNLLIYDINGTLLETIPFVEIESGLFDLTLVPEDQSITNEKIKLEITYQVASDLGDWTDATAAAANSWRSIAFGNGLFVAVSYTGTGNRIMSSPDGITWTSRTNPEDNNWTAVTFGNGLFVAVSSDGANRVMTSPDGITWTVRSASAANAWQYVTYGNGLFVAVASSGSNRAMTSPDGITWTGRAIPSSSWITVGYGNGMFVALGVNLAASSPDGITWTSRTPANAASWRAVAYGGGQFVAVANDGLYEQVMTSPDGITWTEQSASDEFNWEGIAYGDGLFVAVAVSAPGPGIMYSFDGVTWVTDVMSESNARSGITHGDGKFVTVSITGTDRVAVAEITLDQIMLAYSDYLSIKVSHAKTKLIRYSNDTDFAGVIYDTTPVPDFMLRVTAKFFSEGNPEENESEGLSDGSIVKLLGTVKDEKLMEVLPSPFYLHKKLKLVLQHNTIYIDNLAWVKEQNYEIQEPEDEEDPFREGKVWLTKQTGSYVANPFS